MSEREWTTQEDTFTSEVAIVIDTHPQVTESITVLKSLQHRRGPAKPASSHLGLEVVPMRIVWPLGAKILFTHAVPWGVLALVGAVAVFVWQFS